MTAECAPRGDRRGLRRRARAAPEPGMLFSRAWTVAARTPQPRVQYSTVDLEALAPMGVPVERDAVDFQGPSARELGIGRPHRDCSCAHAPRSVSRTIRPPDVSVAPGERDVSAHAAGGHRVAGPQLSGAQVERAQLRRGLEAEIDSARPQRVTTRVGHDARGADVDVVADERAWLSDPAAMRTISPVRSALRGRHMAARRGSDDDSLLIGCADGCGRVEELPALHPAMG